MHGNYKFHHTIQFHTALGLQKVALPSPFFLFSAIVVFTLSSHLAGEMIKIFKNVLEKSKYISSTQTTYVFLVTQKKTYKED